MSVYCAVNFDLPEIHISRQLLLRHAAWLMRKNGVADQNLSILLVNDEEISWLNNQYRKISGPTNVLSFPLAGSGLPELGDIVISVETAAREACQKKYHCIPTSPGLSPTACYIFWDMIMNSEKKKPLPCGILNKI